MGRLLVDAGRPRARARADAGAGVSSGRRGAQAARASGSSPRSGPSARPCRRWTRSVAEEVRRVMEDDTYRRDMVELNYRLAGRFYSYEVLERKLFSVVANIHGQEGEER